MYSPSSPTLNTSAFGFEDTIIIEANVARTERIQKEIRELKNLTLDAFHKKVWEISNDEDECLLLMKEIIKEFNNQLDLNYIRPKKPGEENEQLPTISWNILANEYYNSIRVENSIFLLLIEKLPPDKYIQLDATSSIDSSYKWHTVAHLLLQFLSSNKPNIEFYLKLFLDRLPPHEGINLNASLGLGAGEVTELEQLLAYDILKNCTGKFFQEIINIAKQHKITTSKLNTTQLFMWLEFILNNLEKKKDKENKYLLSFKNHEEAMTDYLHLSTTWEIVNELLHKDARVFHSKEMVEVILKKIIKKKENELQAIITQLNETDNAVRKKLYIELATYIINNFSDFQNIPPEYVLSIHKLIEDELGPIGLVELEAQFKEIPEAIYELETQKELNKHCEKILNYVSIYLEILQINKKLGFLFSPFAEWLTNNADFLDKIGFAQQFLNQLQESRLFNQKTSFPLTNANKLRLFAMSFDAKEQNQVHSEIWFHQIQQQQQLIEAQQKRILELEQQVNSIKRKNPERTEEERPTKKGEQESEETAEFLNKEIVVPDSFWTAPTTPLQEANSMSKNTSPFPSK